MSKDCHLIYGQPCNPLEDCPLCPVCNEAWESFEQELFESELVSCKTLTKEESDMLKRAQRHGEDARKDLYKGQ